MWRGGFIPVGREAAPSFRQPHRMCRLYGGCAPEREQAPSPQGVVGVLQVDFGFENLLYSSACLLALVSGQGFRSPTENNDFAPQNENSGKIADIHFMAVARGRPLGLPGLVILGLRTRA